jgi:hypothetical protein
VVMPDILLRGVSPTSIDSIKFEASRRGITPGELVVRLEELLQRVQKSHSDEARRLLEASNLADPGRTAADERLTAG